MSDKLQKFTDLLQSIFELDRSDLDFGIYRIINIRREEIQKFLSVDLVNKVQETLKPFASNPDEIESRIAEIENACEAVGMDVSSSKMADEYAKLKAQLSAGVDMSALETDVYSALYSFFNRYYDEGDFISKRRYKEGVYAIPYEGEEVKLYWANQDQFYIKSAENFKNYTFKDSNLTVHFRLVDATVEQNNNKENNDNKRIFMLYEETEERPDIKTFEQKNNELIIRFVFDVPTDKKRKYSEENAAKIVEAITKEYKEFFPLIVPRFIDSKTKKQTKSILDKHLEAYVAKNTFDYFIHKDLRGFLTRELDFYIKSEVIHLDDLDTSSEKRVESYLAKVKAIKRVGKIIIDFLAQIEKFQKNLWLKKKLVVETNWCITLDNIDEALYQEIIDNKDQIQEWIDMYAINEIEGDLSTIGYSVPLTVDFLHQNQNLVVDTKHFNNTFKERLIASIDNLDEKTNGLMIHSENFQALNFLQERYKKGVECCYIDPPYNAKSSEILYKNTFKHSAWLSMMNDRLELSKNLLKPKSAHIIAIDENEFDRLSVLVDSVFTDVEKSCIAVVHNPAGVQGKNFSYTHEYAFFIFPQGQTIIGKTEREDDLVSPLRDWGGTSARSLAKNCFYPIIVEDEKIVGFGDVCEDTFHPESAHVYVDNQIYIYPIDKNGIERKWVFGRLSVEKNRDQLFVKIMDGKPEIIRRKSERSYYTVWDDKKYYANIYGSKLLSHIFGTQNFSFPKSVFTVQDSLKAILPMADENAIAVDYFAGSGTTGHAVLNLNREDGGNRKYILVEMGEYFNTVTKPRMQKVIYSAEWKDGKPVNRNTGVSHIMKYFNLESYEDALSNIELSDKGGQLHALFGEEYLINYMLDIEAEGSLLKLDYFKTPFEYKLKVTEKNETKEKVVDLVETFNYLIGLSVIRQSEVAYFSSFSDEKGSYEGAVRLVKDAGGSYEFKQIEGTLPDGRRALIIWRNITDDLITSNAALDAYFTKHRINPLNREYDVIYVNGDNNLENLRSDNENWKVQTLEIDFKKLMFGGE